VVRLHLVALVAVEHLEMDQFEAMVSLELSTRVVAVVVAPMMVPAMGLKFRVMEATAVPASSFSNIQTSTQQPSAVALHNQQHPAAATKSAP